MYSVCVPDSSTLSPREASVQTLFITPRPSRVGLILEWKGVTISEPERA